LQMGTGDGMYSAARARSIALRFLGGAPAVGVVDLCKTLVHFGCTMGAELASPSAAYELAEHVSTMTRYLLVTRAPEIVPEHVAAFCTNLMHAAAVVLPASTARYVPGESVFRMLLDVLPRLSPAGVTTVKDCVTKQSHACAVLTGEQGRRLHFALREHLASATDGWRRAREAFCSRLKEEWCPVTREPFQVGALVALPTCDHALSEEGWKTSMFKVGPMRCAVCRRDVADMKWTRVV